MAKGFAYNRLSRDEAALLLIDHQSGLISLVQNFSPGEFKNNVLALADAGATMPGYAPSGANHERAGR